MRLFNQDTKVEALKRAPLFAGLSKKELTELAPQRGPRGPQGTCSARRATSGQEFFVIVEGGGGHPQGQVARRARDGDFVGEIALLEDTKRTATVTAKTPCACSC